MKTKDTGPQCKDCSHCRITPPHSNLKHEGYCYEPHIMGPTIPTSNFAGRCPYHNPK